MPHEVHQASGQIVDTRPPGQVVGCMSTLRTELAGAIDRPTPLTVVTDSLWTHARLSMHHPDEWCKLVFRQFGDSLYSRTDS